METAIGTIGNYYGGLSVKKEGEISYKYKGNDYFGFLLRNTLFLFYYL